MTRLFDQNWMQSYREEWNRDTELMRIFNDLQFNSTIGYGFPGEPHPRACITIENGKIVKAGDYCGEELNWDLRAREHHWQDWLTREVGSTGIGLAWTTGKLQLVVGDYKQMIHNADYARSFVRKFSVMGRVQAINDEQPETA